TRRSSDLRPGSFSAPPVPVVVFWEPLGFFAIVLSGGLRRPVGRRDLFRGPEPPCLLFAVNLRRLAAPPAGRLRHQDMWTMPHTWNGGPGATVPAWSRLGRKNRHASSAAASYLALACWYKVPARDRKSTRLNSS